MKLEKAKVLSLLAQAAQSQTEGAGYVPVVSAEGLVDPFDKPIPVDPNLGLWTALARRGMVLRDTGTPGVLHFSINQDGWELLRRLAPDTDWQEPTDD